MALERELSRLAARQHGLFTRADVLRLGGSHRMIDRAVAAGRWVPIRPRVLAIAGVPASWEQQLMAVVLSIGAPVAASRETAARLWGLPGFDEAERIHVRLPLARCPSLHGVVAHRFVHWTTATVGVRRGIPVTSLAQTIVDLAGVLDRDALGRTPDDAIRRSRGVLHQVRALEPFLTTGPGRRPSLVRRVLSDRLPRCEPGDSELETRTLRVLARAGMPPPIVGYTVRIDGHRFKIDLASPDRRIAIELDGWAYHGSRTGFERDRLKSNLLQRHGWRVYRFTAATIDADLATVLAA